MGGGASTIFQELLEFFRNFHEFLKTFLKNFWNFLKFFATFYKIVKNFEEYFENFSKMSINRRAKKKTKFPKIGRGASRPQEPPIGTPLIVWQWNKPKALEFLKTYFGFEYEFGKIAIRILREEKLLYLLPNPNLNDEDLLHL
jgi:hypothetical protein